MLRGVFSILFLAATAYAFASLEVDEETWSYFKEIALQAEYQEIEPVVRKWTQPIHVRVFGDPDDSDLGALAQVVRELRELSGDRLRFHFVTGNDYYNLAIHFVPHADFSRYAPIPRGKEVRGYFVLRWLEDFSIHYATVLVSNDPALTEAERHRLIREEFTQAMGLINDSMRYPDSIFQEKWTDLTEYSGMDRMLIRMLYHPDVKPGMDSAAFRPLFGLSEAQP